MLFFLLWPLFIISFLIIGGIINGIVIQSVIFVCGLLLCMFIWYIFGKDPVINQDSICGINSVQLLGYDYTSPSLNTIILWFINAYLLSSMIATGKFSPSIIIILLLGAIGNSYVLIINKCTTLPPFFWSLIIGICIGIIWFFIFWQFNKHLIYFSQYLEKAEVCVIPKEQTISCSEEEE